MNLSQFPESTKKSFLSTWTRQKGGRIQFVWSRPFPKNGANSGGGGRGQHDLQRKVWLWRNQEILPLCTTCKQQWPEGERMSYWFEIGYCQEAAG